MTMRTWVYGVVFSGLLLGLAGCGQQPGGAAQVPAPQPQVAPVDTKTAEAAKTEGEKSMSAEIPPEKLPQTEDEWKKILTPDQFRVARQKGTERAFTGEFWNNHKPGVYRCVCCGAELFKSDTKFDSGTGWPSFYQAAAEGRVKDTADNTHGMQRVEVTCKRCGAHLGHVFDDGPEPTGLRYCINSVSLKFEEKK
ncbi:MAG: peptide-methionine (R)-S-oxide reductase MsrB [Planctomycetes bacterium]|nr:peptide-methionine (R)-S-oxide reductase MsrB [Planctomycetota bacterium]